MRDGAWVIAAMVIASGCVRTGAVGRYAKAAGETAAELPALAEEMRASCVRLEGYREARKGAVDGERGAGAWFARSDLEGRCTERAKAAKRAVVVGRALASYFAALGALADDKVVKYDASVDDLADALEEDARLDGDRVRAVSGLASFAASVATDGYRHLKLSRVIEEQNGNVSTAVDALVEIVGTDYASFLELETTGMESFYRSVLAEGAAREPLAAILVLDARDGKAAALEEKRAVLGKYVKALGTMKSGHRRLYASRRDLNAAVLARELAEDATQLEKLATALREAF